jgi:type I restriction enzyme S subunit
MCEIITKQTGFDYSATIKPSLLTESSNETYSFIQNKDFSGNEINLDTDFYIPIEVAERFPKILLDKPSLLISISGRIGNVGFYNLPQKSFIGGAVGICKLRNSQYGEFLVQELGSDYGQNYFRSLIKASSHANITVEDIRNINIIMPKDDCEQEKIASYFNNLDNLITLHQRKCDKLEEYKKAMLQKIFSQELRFKREDGTEYPEWEEKKFGTTVLIERGGSPRPIKQYITNGDGYNWVKIGDAPEHGNYITHTEEKIKKSGLNKTRQVFKGDLILSNSMSFGKPYIMAIDGCIHDGWLLIRNNQNIYNLKFLCYLLGTDYMLKQYKSLAGGSTVNNLNKELVSMTTVSVPCLEEQQKIADFLSALNETISYAKQEFDKWKELKKGLLQQMFV